MFDCTKGIEGVDWGRLRLLIEQTEARIALWEVEERRAERKYHRGLREIDARGMTKAENIFEATWEMVAGERLWVPDDKLQQDRALLADLKALRAAMLASSDGSECEK
jgi:hypothetical protein